MSLEKFYYGEYSDDGTDEDFNPDEVEDSEGENEDSQEEGSSKIETKVDEEAKKRKIEELWKDMNGSSETASFSGKGKEKFIENPQSVVPGAKSNSNVECDQSISVEEEKSDKVNTPESSNKIQSESSKKTKTIKNVSKKASKFSQIEAEVGASYEKKLNTVEQSKLKWEKLVEKENIKAELETHNKDGYVEKLQLLDRLDDQKAEYIQKLKKN
ncbi:SWR1-complex protein 5 [Smittium mucronatum]|uniref:SWR1-complex protein 5 n=1 Tax=Smittium mucronatum TaxID=133383 RepID=A0A1R0GZ28_9FUNG|nr:SWR1-complex protein 5 [Smittium mucronatum]